MKNIITNLDDLRTASEPIKFIKADGIDKTECNEIIKELHEVMNANPELKSLSAPQIGINKRIFCIRFNDAIKTFIDPIIKEKRKFALTLETCSSMPGKEIVISRPQEITIVYWSDEFKNEDNKLLGAAAAIFDQQNNILDGILPDELGLVSDIELDGPVTDEDLANPELQEFYANFVKTKSESMAKAMEADEETAKQFEQLKFTESVINGRSVIVSEEEAKISQQAKKVAAMSTLRAEKAQKAIRRAELQTFLRRKGK